MEKENVSEFKEKQIIAQAPGQIATRMLSEIRENIFNFVEHRQPGEYSLLTEE